MKKVLIVTHVSGFLPQFEMGNVNLLQEMGCEVHYASNFKNPQYGNDNSRLEGTGIICHQIDFSRSPYRIRQNIRAFKQICKLLDSEEYNFVHCHTPVGGAITRLASVKCANKRMKVIYTVHGFHFFNKGPLINWMIFYPVERLLARFTDVIITINKEDYKIASNFKLKLNGKVKKVNGVGINVKDFSGIFEKKWSKEKTLNKLTILSIGELNSNKNHKLVIRALRKIDHKKFKYFICGEGTGKKKISELIKRYSLENQVHLVGYVKDVKSVLMQADVFVMPSFREGLPVSLQEAMAAGLPVIATDIRGNNELVDHNRGGWLVPSNDEKSMCKILEQVFSSDLYAMGRYNLNKIKEYDKKTISDAMQKIYVDVLKEDL